MTDTRESNIPADGNTAVFEDSLLDYAVGGGFGARLMSGGTFLLDLMADPTLAGRATKE